MVLFISFGYFDEVRALSLAFPALTLIALNGANRFTEIFSSATEPVKIAGDSPLVQATFPHVQRET